jgi:cysteine synthase
MLDNTRKLAAVTGASTGIGLELARQCAKHDFDLIIAANEAEIESAADDLRRDGAKVETVKVDLATLRGVDKLYEKRKSRGSMCGPIPRRRTPLAAYSEEHRCLLNPGMAAENESLWQFYPRRYQARRYE